MPIISSDMKSFPTELNDNLDTKFLGNQKKDSQLGQLRKHNWVSWVLVKDREGFHRQGSYIVSFWDDAAAINDCRVIENRVAIPTCMRKAVMSRVQRTHPGQEAMIDAPNISDGQK